MGKPLKRVQYNYRRSCHPTAHGAVGLGPYLFSSALPFSLLFQLVCFLFLNCHYGSPLSARAHSQVHGAFPQLSPYSRSHFGRST